MQKIGFGGGCHWCTEAVFQQLVGVLKVEQGWIASDGENNTFSEAVIIHFDDSKIDLATLTAIHLHTHSSTSNHTMRKKYRSAVYTFSFDQAKAIKAIINSLQTDFDKAIITQVLPFYSFKVNKEQYQNYYLKNSDNQFCRTYIHPKFSLLMQRFSSNVDRDKLKYALKQH